MSSSEDLVSNSNERSGTFPRVRNDKCLCAECRFPDSHVTSAHCCGVCKQFEHGLLECGKLANVEKLRDLSRGHMLHPSQWCTIVGCEYRYTHNNASHHCSYCKDREHSITQCEKVSSSILATRNLTKCNGNDIEPKLHKLKCPMCNVVGNVSETPTTIELKGIDNNAESLSCIFCNIRNKTVVFKCCNQVVSCKPCYLTLIHVMSSAELKQLNQSSLLQN
jgi:hypothetical protein